MSSKDSHLSDQELLLAADGELPPARAGQVASHLTECWTCRVRKGELEASIGDFVRTYRGDLDPLLPSPAGPRALLKAQLAEMTAERADIPVIIGGREIHTGVVHHTVIPHKHSRLSATTRRFRTRLFFPPDKVRLT